MDAQVEAPMRPHDQQRFAALVAEFIVRCGVEPPFHLVAIGANGALSKCASPLRRATSSRR